MAGILYDSVAVTPHSSNMLISRQASTGLVLQEGILVWKKGCVYLTVGKIVQRLTLVKNNNCYHLG